MKGIQHMGQNKNILKHNGYIGEFEIDLVHNMMTGHIAGINDVVTFSGKTVKELQKAFESSVDDYLETCKALGEDPEKPYSGKFNVRIPSDLHRILALVAKTQGTSLNDVVVKALTKEANRKKKYV